MHSGVGASRVPRPVLLPDAGDRGAGLRRSETPGRQSMSLKMLTTITMGMTDDDADDDEKGRFLKTKEGWPKDTTRPASPGFLVSLFLILL